MARELRRLPRDKDGKLERSFYAKGKRFIIRSPSEGIGIYRYSRLLQMSSVFGYGAELADQQKNWAKVGELLNEFVRGENVMGDIFAHIQSQYNGIKADSDRAYHIAYWVATLFVVTETEDLTVWTQDEQSEKIKMWEEFHEEDFFDLALNGLEEFSRMSRRQNDDENNSQN
jgi:hypothetical protein